MRAHRKVPCYLLLRVLAIRTYAVQVPAACLSLFESIPRRTSALYLGNTREHTTVERVLPRQGCVAFGDVSFDSFFLEQVQRLKHQVQEFLSIVARVPLHDAPNHTGARATYTGSQDLEIATLAEGLHGIV